MIEHEFYKLADLSTNILLICRQDGYIEYCNRRSNFFPNDLDKTHRSLFQLLGDENKDLLSSNLIQTSDYQLPNAIKLSYKQRHYNIYFYPLLKKTAVCIEDITEKYELSGALNIIKNRLQFAEKSAHIGYWEFDFNNRKIYWSEEMYRIFNVNPASKSAKANIILERIIAEDIPVYKQKLREMLLLKQDVEGKVRIQKYPGQISECYFKASLLATKENKIAGTFQDLTELLTIQRHLEEAKQKADIANMAKSDFLAKASHDLRQPLQALTIFIHNLLSENLAEKPRDIAQKILLSTANLRNLMDNLLDISKLETGIIKVHNSKFNIKTLIDNLTVEYQALASANNIKLRSFCSHNIIYSDAHLIERILRNFLSNAVKFSKDKILLTCRYHNNCLQISVIDNGVGLNCCNTNTNTAGYMEHNFKQGSGLGLLIAKKSAELIHADINIQSKSEHGSCFTLSINL